MRNYLLILALVCLSVPVFADETLFQGAQLVIKKEAKPIPFLRIKGQRLETKEEGEKKSLFLKMKVSYSAKGAFLVNDKKTPAKDQSYSFDTPLTNDETDIKLSVVGKKPGELYVSVIRVVLTPGLAANVPPDPSSIEISVLDENQPFPQKRVVSSKAEAFQVNGRVAIHYSTSSTQIYPVLGVDLKFNVQNNIYVKVPVDAWLVTATTGKVSPVVSPLLMGGMEWQSFFGEAGGGAVLFTEVNRVWVLQADIGYSWKKAFFSRPLALFVGYRAHFSSGTRDSVFFSGLSFGFY